MASVTSAFFMERILCYITRAKNSSLGEVPTEQVSIFDRGGGPFDEGGGGPFEEGSVETATQVTIVIDP
jgi:hypothetical protein